MINRIVPDVWLAEILGFTCFRLAAPADVIEAVNLLAQLDEQANDKRSFAYVKVPCNQVEIAARFTQSGFYVVDVSLTFHREPLPLREYTRISQVSVQSASREEYLLAREIAGQCIIYSRFHMDPYLSKQQGDAVNWAWLDNYYSGRRGEDLQVARLDGQVVGFNAILASQSGGRPCRVIDLIGVSRAAQRQGVGQMMMEKFIDDTTKLGLPMQVTTQAANIPAVKLYEQNGFRLIESALVLHRHVL